MPARSARSGNAAPVILSEAKDLTRATGSLIVLPGPSLRSGRQRSFLRRVRDRQPFDQLVQRVFDLSGVASHQDSVRERVGAEGFDFLDVLVQDFDLFEARHRLAVRLTPRWRRLGNPCVHHFCPVVPLNMNLASSSVKEMASWVWVISPPALIIVLSPPGSSTTTMPPSSDSLTTLALVSAGTGTFDDTAMSTIA